MIVGCSLLVTSGVVDTGVLLVPRVVLVLLLHPAMVLDARPSFHRRPAVGRIVARLPSLSNRRFSS